MSTQNKEHLINKILEELNCGTRDILPLKEEVNRALVNYEVIKNTNVNYCQSCRASFNEEDNLVFYVPIDNNIVCVACSKIHHDKELRFFRKYK